VNPTINSSRNSGMGKEFPHTDQIIYLTALAFLLTWFLDTFLFIFSTFLNAFIPLFLRLIFFAFFLIIALKLGLSSHSMLFNDNNGKKELITTGIFARVRHPLYLSILLLYLGLISLSLSLISIAIWIFIFFLFNKMVTYEERDLERIFSDKFLEYKKAVPKWFPKLY